MTSNPLTPLTLAKQILDAARLRARTEAERQLVSTHTAALAFGRSGRLANGVDIACAAITESAELRAIYERALPEPVAAPAVRTRKCMGSKGEEHVQTSEGYGPWRCTCKSFRFCPDAIRHCKHTRPLTHDDELARAFPIGGAA